MCDIQKVSCIYCIYCVSGVVNHFMYVISFNFLLQGDTSTQSLFAFIQISDRLVVGCC